MVAANGLAETLWSVASVVLEMLRVLWHSELQGGVAVGFSGQPLEAEGDSSEGLDPEGLGD